MRESDGGAVEVDLGAGAGSVAPGQAVIDLTAKRSIPVPAEGPVDWAQLSKVPGCITLIWKGAERGVVEAVRANHITFFYWYDADGDVDLTGTSVTDVRLSGEGLRSVALPRGAETLLMHDPPPRLRVEAPGVVDLRVFFTHEKVEIPKLPGVRRLWLRVPKRLSTSALDGFTQLERLHLDLDSPPGTLTGMPELARLGQLRQLEISDAYDWDPDELPDIPTLVELSLNGTRRGTAAAVKTRFKGTPVHVTVSDARSDKWLAEHMDNPFRDWADESAKVGRAACKAYVRAAGTVEAGDVEAGLRGLVADLNAINAWYSFDTLLREHAWYIFLELAKGAGVAEDQAELWFDNDRDF